jgi:anion transporter
MPVVGRLTARRVGGAAVLLAALAIGLANVGGEPRLAWSLALIVLSIGLWASAAIPEHVTALVFFALAMLIGLAPASVAFAGFHAGATWLVFGGLVLGVAVNVTGLGARIAGRLTGAFGRSYAGLVFGMLSVGIALAFVMPSSMSRVLLLMPIGLALADKLGYAHGSNGRTAIVLAILAGAFLIPFSILPANVPNVILLGIGEDLYHFTPTYGGWLALHFPVLGVVKALVAGVLILRFFPDHPPAAAAESAPGPLSGAEWRLSLILACALLGWLTDFAHHISPAWIALVAAAACLIPMAGLLEPHDFGKVNFGSIIYVAGILGIGAFIEDSGWGVRLGAALIHAAPLGPGQPFANFLALTGIGVGVGLTTTLPGIPAVMTPLAKDLAQATGLPLGTVLMLQVPAFSTALFVYQGPPLAVAIQVGWVSFGNVTKLLVAVAVATVLLLLPLDYLWWRLLGAI